MKFLTLAKILMILILPVLLVLLVLQIVAFSGSFYRQEFSEYGVNQQIPGAPSLHEKVLNFVEGKSNELPIQFNEREKQHLWDVRNISSILTIVFYILIIVFIILLLVSSFTLKVNNIIANFVGKVLVFGGILTLALGAILLIFIKSDFSSGFESFHRLFFNKGTYTFDPANEMIVKLYPEQLFMDLGIKVSAWVVAASVLAILIGLFFLHFLFKPKSKKNK